MSDDLDALKKEVKALRDRLDPPPQQPNRAPYDHTQGMAMPPSAMRAMAGAIPDNLMGALRADSRLPNPVTQGPNPQPQPHRRGSGWAPERPLETPHIAHVDRLVDAQDIRDRVELAQRLAQAGLGKSKG